VYYNHKSLLLLNKFFDLNVQMILKTELQAKEKPLGKSKLIIVALGSAI
jgi:hypothetical protein